MFEKIKARITEHLIESEIRKQRRVKKAVNLEKAKRVGILFSFLDENVVGYVDDFISKLAENGKVVQGICYLPEEQIPDYYLSKLKIDVLQPKDLSFFGIPNTQRTKDFIKQEFDILLDMSLIDESSLDYIATMSHATFKVGRYRKNMLRVFDLMIRKSEDMDFKDYYKSFFQYLSRIK
jgi:hypothetical protein